MFLDHKGGCFKKFIKLTAFRWNEMKSNNTFWRGLNWHRLKKIMVSSKLHTCGFHYNGNMCPCCHAEKQLKRCEITVLWFGKVESKKFYFEDTLENICSMVNLFHNSMLFYILIFWKELVYIYKSNSLKPSSMLDDSVNIC